MGGMDGYIMRCIMGKYIMHLRCTMGGYAMPGGWIRDASRIYRTLLFDHLFAFRVFNRIMQPYTFGDVWGDGHVP
jgi:hypothetical protein